MGLVGWLLFPGGLVQLFHAPPCVLGYVLEWAVAHEPELMRCWDSLQGDRPVGKIEPLL